MDIWVATEILFLQILFDMNFTKLVPNIFYTDISDALRLFIDCLEFTIEHDELKSVRPFCVTAEDGLTTYTA